jgi:NAD(P)-dependent dehydrogenase (short-subunit alcohol dehydrogenase family)
VTLGAVGCAVVTGASSGIGRAIAVELAHHGVDVVASARRAPALEELVAQASSAGGQVVAHPADLTDAEAVTGLFAAAASRFGHVGIVVHSVGHDYRVGPLWEMSPHEVQDVVAAMVTSPALVLREALHNMRAAGGLVLLVSSGAAYRTTPGRCLYSAAKAAVNQLVLSAALEVEAGEGPDLAVVAVLPGRVDTPMQRRLVDAAQTAPASFRLSGFTSMAGVSTAEDVGRAVVQLTQRPPAELNGAVLRLTSGGWEAAR